MYSSVLHDMALTVTFIDKGIKSSGQNVTFITRKEK